MMKGIRIRRVPFSRRSSEGTIHGVIILILLIFILFPFLTDHGDTGLTCRFHELTGLSCPTCGMSRSLYELVHLHIAQSFRMHLLGPVLYLIAFVLFLKYTLEIFAGKKIIFERGNRFFKKILVLLIIVWIVFWIVRMGMEYWGMEGWNGGMMESWNIGMEVLV